MTTLERLKQGRQRIMDGWCKGDPVQEKDGKIYYCALGAIDYCDHRSDTKECMNAYHYLRKALNNMTTYDSIGKFNDAANTKHRQVIVLYDKAIELAAKV